MKAIFTQGGFEILDLENRLKSLENKIDFNVKRMPEYLTLKSACDLKGIAYGSVHTNRILQPNCGFTKFKFGSKRYFHNKEVQRWFSVWEYNLHEYITELLESSDEKIVCGVVGELGLLKYRDRINKSLWEKIKRHPKLKGIDAYGEK
jgi:hypothetical protein